MVIRFWGTGLVVRLAAVSGSPEEMVVAASTTVTFGTAGAVGVVELPVELGVLPVYSMAR